MRQVLQACGLSGSCSGWIPINTHRIWWTTTECVTRDARTEGRFTLDTMALHKKIKREKLVSGILAAGGKHTGLQIPQPAFIVLFEPVYMTPICMLHPNIHLSWLSLLHPCLLATGFWVPKLPGFLSTASTQVACCSTFPLQTVPCCLQPAAPSPTWALVTSDLYHRLYLPFLWCRDYGALYWLNVG